MRTEPPAPAPAPPPRLSFVDSLRGFALFGVFGANLLIFSGWTYMNDEQKAGASTALDRVAYGLEQLLVENKFIGLFSLLFGVSFWLFIDRARARGGSPTTLFYRRIFWLFVIGALHGWLLWAFDVLRFYALWAVLLPLFARLPPRRLLASALTAAVLVPAGIAGLRGVLPHPGPPAVDYDALALAAFSTGGYWDFLSANWRYDWYLTLDVGQIGYQVAVFGRLLLGLYAALTLDLGHLTRHRTLLVRLVLFGAIAGAIGNGIFAAGVLAGTRGFLLPFVRRFCVEAGYLGLTLAYAAALALLWARPRWTRAVETLAPLGRMALTFYLLQTLAGLWLFYGCMPGPGLMGRVGPAGLAAITVAGYAVQVGLAHAWMRSFRFGPAEWLWRSLTYRSVQPFAHRAAP